MTWMDSVAAGDRRGRIISQKPLAVGPQIRNILCPVDFSESSQRAFSYATCIARHFRSRLFVQHTVAIPAGAIAGGTEPLGAYPALDSARQLAGADIRRLAAVARLQLPEVHLLVNDGDICDCLLQCMEENNVDLVVMGARGRKGFAHLALGSVTERIVHEASCPVLVISRPVRDFVAPEEHKPVELKRILLATDFSSNAAQALALGLQWASEWSAKLILFHAVEEGTPGAPARVDRFPEYNPYFEKLLVEARETIQTRRPAPANETCEISFEVRRGNPKEQIPKVAEENGADLIVMGSSGLARTAAVCGSTISAVLRDGRFPVLAVRHRQG